MFHAQISFGAVMGEADGWQQPARFGPTANELELLRTSAGVYDISPNGQVRVIGTHAATVVERLTPNQPDLAVGMVRPAEIETSGGSISAMVARLTQDEFAVLTAPGQAPAVVEFLEAAPDSCAHVLDISAGLAGVALTGPSSAEILSAITQLDISAQGMYNQTCAQSQFAEIHGLLVRNDIVGLPSYQLHVSREFGEYFWEAVIDAAQEIGAGPVGTEAVAGLLN
jgi:dimethylglycine dehydrogenase